MKNYIKYVLPFKNSFRKIEINRRELTSLENLVVKHLNVRDLNELRDKFEGQAFLDNFIHKALPIIGMEKYLKKNFINLENRRLDQIKSEIIVNNTVINLIKFDNQLPLIDAANNQPYIFMYSSQKQILELCGFATAEDVKNNLKDIKSYGFGSKVSLKGAFDGFEHLQVFNNYEELVKLVE